MSRNSINDDRWLDVCMLLSQLKNDGKVTIFPTEQVESFRKLSFIINGRFSGDDAQSLVEVFSLADWFEFTYIENNIVATVFVDLSATST